MKKILVIAVMVVVLGTNVIVFGNTEDPKGDAPLTQSTLILRPNGPGMSTQWTAYGDSPNWRCVDEGVPDEYTTFVACPEFCWIFHGLDFYSLPDHTTENGVISSITLYARVCNEVNLFHNHFRIHVGTAPSTNYFSPWQVLPPDFSFHTYSWTWQTCPWTSQPWTWAQVDSLQIGMYNWFFEDDPGAVRCTQLYAEISYVPIPNYPPYLPSYPSPTYGAIDVPVNTELSWTGGDPDQGDIVTYDVHLGTTLPAPLVANEYSTTSYHPTLLAYDTLYYWYIVARDNHGLSTIGQTWFFTTEPQQPNNPPYIPMNPQPVNNSLDNPVYTILRWTGGDPDSSDSLIYTVRFGYYPEFNFEKTIGPFDGSQTSISCNVGLFGSSTTFIWQVGARDNHEEWTWGPIWSFTTAQEPSTVALTGGVYYYEIGGEPVESCSVDVINLDSWYGFQASAWTQGNIYIINLLTGDEIWEGAQMRVIAKDSYSSVGIVEETISPLLPVINIPVIVNIHCQDLEKFPYYPSVFSGPMVMKQMLDWCMWNSILYPVGPQSLYNEYILFERYRGADGIIDVDELCYGINNEIDDFGHGWIYGYFFAPYADTDKEEVLQQICTWIDYPISFHNDIRLVPVPFLGHPNHVAAAIPAGGDFDHWLIVRGIYTDRNAWYGPSPVTVYGVWLNDPLASSVGGIGENWYVTTQYFLDTCLSPISVTGSPYYGKYVAVIDPPRNVPRIDASQSSILVEKPEPLSNSKIITINSALKKGVSDVANKEIGAQALKVFNEVIQYSNYRDNFLSVKVTGITKKGTEYVVDILGNGLHAYVHLDAKNFALNAFQIY